eukprot:653472-Prorocentrum_minimum.AAC.1
MLLLHCRLEALVGGGGQVCNLYQQKSGLPGIVTKNNCFDNKATIWKDGIHDGAYWGRSKY